jgi:hypothetical protein
LSLAINNEYRFRESTHGKEVGDFSFTATSITVSSTANGGVEQQVNLEGTATGFGAVLGTLTFYASEPGAESGFVTWNGTAYLEDGGATGGMGRGVFNTADKHTWRVRSIIQIKDGPVLLTEGEIALEGKSYTGKLYQWE